MTTGELDRGARAVDQAHELRFLAEEIRALRRRALPEGWTIFDRDGSLVVRSPSGVETTLA